MQRREFLNFSMKLPVALLGLGVFLEKTHGIAAACESISGAQTQGMKSFAFYQGLGPTQLRSADRPDGTFSSMPCISEDDVAAGEAKTYEFWHGHGGKNHKFTVDSESFAKLKAGESVEIYTDVVTGHRHALKIDPNLECTIS